MAEIRIINYVEAVGIGKIKPEGDLNVPIVITLDGTNPKVHTNRHTIALNATAEILRVGSADGDDLPSFKYLRIAPSTAMAILLMGAATTDTSVITVAAGTVLEITSDDTRADEATYADRLALAASDITKVYAKALAAGYVDVLAAF